MTLLVMNGCDMGKSVNEGWELAGCTVGRDTISDIFTSSLAQIWSGTRVGRWRWASGGEYRVDFGAGKFTGDTIWGGFWWRIGGTSAAVATEVIGIHRGGSTWIGAGNSTHDAAFSVFSIEWAGDRTNTYVIKDATDTIIGDPLILDPLRWYWVAFEADAVSVGTLSVKIDGYPWLSAEAGDFAGTSATGDQYSFCTSNVWDQYFDDFVFGDGAGSVNNSIPDPGRVQAIWPDADSSNTGYTTLLPTTPVDRYSKLNESSIGTTHAEPDDDTSYCDTAAVSDEYTVTLDDIAASPTSILAYQQIQRARRSSGADTVTLRNRLFSGATYYNGTDKVTGDSFVNVNDIWELDPDTAVAWTESGINALLASGIMV